MPNSEYYNAAEHALANFLGTDDLDQDMIELVGDCMNQAVAALPNATYFENLLEKASSYVQADMNDDELSSWVAELENRLEDYGLL